MNKPLSLPWLKSMNPDIPRPTERQALIARTRGIKTMRGVIRAQKVLVQLEGKA